MNYFFQKNVFLGQNRRTNPNYDSPVFEKFQKTSKYTIPRILIFSVRFFKNNEKIYMPTWSLPERYL